MYSTRGVNRQTVVQEEVALREKLEELKPGERARQRVRTADGGTQSLRPMSLTDKPQRKNAAECQIVTALLHSDHYSKSVWKFRHPVTSLQGCFRGCGTFIRQSSSEGSQSLPVCSLGFLSADTMSSATSHFRHHAFLTMMNYITSDGKSK